MSCQCCVPHKYEKANVVSHGVGAVLFVSFALYLTTWDVSGSVCLLNLAGNLSVAVLFIISAVNHASVGQRHAPENRMVAPSSENQPLVTPPNATHLSNLRSSTGLWRMLDIVAIYLSVGINACADLAALSMHLAPSECDECSAPRDAFDGRTAYQGYADPMAAAFLGAVARVVWYYHCGGLETYAQCEFVRNERLIKPTDGKHSSTFALIFAVFVCWWVPYVTCGIRGVPSEYYWLVACSASAILVFACGAYQFTATWSPCLPTGLSGRESSCQTWCGMPHFHWHLVTIVVCAIGSGLRYAIIARSLESCLP